MKKRSIVITGGFAATLLFVGAGCSAYKTVNVNASNGNVTANAAPAVIANTAASTGAEKLENTNAALQIQNINVGAAGNANAAPATNTGASRSNASLTQSVAIKNYAFSPADLDVKAGTTVTWTNLDSVAHTVTGDNGGPASGTISPQGIYSYTFSTPGSYSYHCAPHPYMTGSVTVTQ